MPEINKDHLKSTPILDFDKPEIASLIQEQGWLKLSNYEKIGAAYDFVRNEIKFGYNISDNIPASSVLKDGYGQCNTKGTLLMALLRALDIPCRLHGFTIHKSLQRGIVPELIYPIAPENILHSWVEVCHENRWVHLEGFILDDPYLKNLQRGLGNGNQGLCSYGAGVEDLSNLQVKWCGKNTFIQHTGINNDYGTYATPDEFYAVYTQDFPFWKKWLHNYIVRHWMNRRAEQLRQGKLKLVRF